MDVMFHIGTGSQWDNGELRYALRALERNFAELDRVFICGIKPPWLTSVVHISVPDKHKHNKDANLIDKVVAACSAGISERFVRSSDDMVILLPSLPGDLGPFHSGNLSEKGEKFWRGGWKKRLKRTKELLDERKASTWHFDTHTPKVYCREDVLRIADEVDYASGGGYTIDTLILNLSGADGSPLGNRKLTLEGRRPKLRNLRKSIKGKRFLGYNDGGLGDDLKQYLQEAFQEPSRFENDGGVIVQGADLTDSLPTVVAVVGTGRSGTSVAAGIVHHLGVSMGSSLREPTHNNPKGFFEDMPLRSICRKRPDSGTYVRRLREWAADRSQYDGNMVGAKYVLLCNRVSEMVDAWPKLKMIVTHRPIEEIVRSMVAARMDTPLDDPEAMRRLAVRRIKARDVAIKKLKPDTLHVEFHDIINRPKREIDRITAFLGITPTDKQRQTALSFVDPSLHHHKLDYCDRRFTCPHSRDCREGGE